MCVHAGVYVIAEKGGRGDTEKEGKKKAERRRETNDLPVGKG